jgi:S-adenosylhomocysteine hydrolase
MLEESRTALGQAVLICGLGRLGQHCAFLLKELGVPVFGLTDVELVPEVEGMPALLDRLTVADSRRQARAARAALTFTRSSLVVSSTALHALMPASSSAECIEEADFRIMHPIEN